MSERVKKTEEKRIGAGKAGPGRPAGIPNKLAGDVKAMILAALEGAGGQAYLQRQAEENPTAFMTLVGKVLPMTVANPDGSNLAAPQFIVNAVASEA